MERRELIDVNEIHGFHTHGHFVEHFPANKMDLSFQMWDKQAKGTCDKRILSERKTHCNDGLESSN